MRSISLDNPYLLLVAIPLLALVFIPYFITIRKENKSKSTVATLIIHTVIVLLVSVALAGLHSVTVKTKTQVLVVADVSYSTSRSFDEIDGYINQIMDKESLPMNTEVGVVCFGKDAKLVSNFGEQFNSVKNSGVDESATDIVSALTYASTLFDGDAIKRIVLITDGKQTVLNDSGLLSAVEVLDTKGIYIDAVYTDSNLKNGEYEVQVADIEYVPSTYLNSEATLKVLVQSNTDYIPNANNPKDRNDAFIRLYDSEGNIKAQVSEPLHKGFNLFTIDLDTSVGGTMDYKVVVEATHDVSLNNNSFSFTQVINEKLQVLLVSTNKEDLARANELYGDDAEIYAPLLLKKKEPVPFSIEELCKYDEFIISDYDIKQLDNVTAFLANLDTVISKFGKSLITAGNTFIQNQEDEVYKTLEDMLAIKYGNTEGDPKLYALVIDASRSMQDAYQLIMAKEAAIQLVNMMSPQDYVMVVAFSGEVTIAQRPTPVSSKDEIIHTINSLKPTQGTVLGAGLRVAYEQMVNQPFYEKYVMLISDGRSYAAVNENDDALLVTSQLYKAGIHTSTINTNSAVGKETLETIAKAGRGESYFITSVENVKEVVSTEIADDMTESVIEKDTPIIIEDYNDPLVAGITELPNIKGYYFGKVKSNANVVLSAEYVKPNGGKVSVPIYSYWNYGNGRVTTIATTFSGKWVSAWENDLNGKEVFNRILTTNTPKERIDHPFNIEVSYEGTTAVLEVLPAEANPDIVVDVEIIMPSGTSSTHRIFYEAGIYKMSFSAEETGIYRVNVSYIYGDEVFSASESFDNPYAIEYNKFEIFDASALHDAIGSYGRVSEGKVLKIENDKDEVETYIQYYTVYFMALAVVLYVIDIIVRKLKWSDIKSFFRKSRAGGKAK